MTNKKQFGNVFDIPTPKKNPEIDLPADPEEPFVAENDPDVIPDEDIFETPPYEEPVPGEAP